MTSYNYSIHAEDNELKQPVAIIKWPGIAEFFTRDRYMGAGFEKLMGRAWVGGNYILSISQKLIMETLGLMHLLPRKEQVHEVGNIIGIVHYYHQSY
jgi:hypothetical protein